MLPKTARNKPSTASAVPAKASCCICCQSVKPDKDEVLFCTGGCQQWLHRYCASVSVDGYKSMKSDNSPFLCFCCYRSRKEEQLSTLEKTVLELKAELSELRKRSPAVPPREASPASRQHQSLPEKTYASVTAAKTGELASQFTPVTHSQGHHPDRKFNIVLYGVDECPQGTTRAGRFESDLSQAVSVLSTIDSTIQPQSIRDCYRLGKFSTQNKRPRPILLKLIRISDMTKILSNKGSLPKPFLIKPDMSPEQRLIESVLLKERWSLIQSGVARNSIKIRNTRLFVNKKLHGQVMNSKFVHEHPVPLLQLETASCRKNVVDVVPIVLPENRPSESHVLSSSVGPPATPHTSPNNLTNSSDNFMNSDSQSISPSPNSSLNPMAPSHVPHSVTNDNSTSQLPVPDSPPTQT